MRTFEQTPHPKAEITDLPAVRPQITGDLEALLQALPPRLLSALRQDPALADLLEVVLDIGRPPEARFPGREVVLSADEVSQGDLDYVLARISLFSGDNRAGIARTLHRISAMRSRDGRIIGLTCRVGRAVFGTIAIIQDLIETGQSILLLGRPGVGKTTMLREVARVLADDFRKRVIIVDTSNEIGGDGDIPHPAIGRARRMQVPKPELQHAVMIEAVENHMPEVIVIDEIGTELEAAAARTIAERGVQLVATAHGNTLENLMLNPTLSDLIGGIQSVTLGDEEARRRGTQKTILERRAPPTFDIVVEIQDWGTVVVHHDVAEVVDSILRGFPTAAEVRHRREDGQIERQIERDYFGAPQERKRQDARRRPAERRESAPRRAADRPAAPASAPPAEPKRASPLQLYPFGVNRKRLARAARMLEVPVNLVDELPQAGAVLTLQSYYRQAPRRLREAEEAGIPVYVLKANTVVQIENALSLIFGRKRGGEEEAIEEALGEVQTAIEQVLNGERDSVELTPQNAYIRRLQHQMIERYHLGSQSQGREPQRRVRVYRAEDKG